MATWPKMYILHHQVDLPNYNTLPPSIIPFWKAIDQANGIVYTKREVHKKNGLKSNKMAKKWPKIAKNKPKPRKNHATTKCYTFLESP